MPFSVLWEFLLRLSCLLLALLLTLTLAARPCLASPGVDFDIPPSSADKALHLFALQGDVQLLYPYDQVKTIQVNGLKGTFTIERGIHQLIKGTKLIAIADADNLVIRLQENNEGITMQNSNLFSTFTKSLLAVLVGSVTSASHAQTTGTPDAKGSVLMEEVITTARKKAIGESVQDTPIAVSAFDERQFKAVFADNLSDLGNLAPNVEMKQAGNVGVQNFAIRGMGVSGTTPSDSPAVGVFQNGVFWGTNYGSLLDTFDVESVEILRGPQGTLFGRNVTGGAVVVRTKRPDQEFGLSAEVLAGDYGRQDYSFAVEGAIVDTLSGRIVVMDRSLDGYYTNLATGNDFGEHGTTLVRGTLVFEPNDDFDATLILEDYDEDGDSVAAIGIERAGNLPYQNGYRQPSDWWDIRLDNPGTAKNQIQSSVLEMNLDLGHGVVTSITGYRDVEVDHNTDFDGSEFSGFNRSLWLAQDQLSEEIRYASTFSDTLEFTLGAYYFEQEQDYREGRDLASSTTGAEHATVFAAGSALEQSSWALFGELDYNLSEAWILTLGGRYTTESIEGQSTNFGVCPLDASIPNPYRIRNLSLPCDLGPSLEENWNDFSPKVGLTWMPDDKNLVYGSVTQGFRSGGFSMRGNPIRPPFDAEEVLAYEIGYKGDLLDDHLRLNIALFQNDYQDLQRTVLVDVPLEGVKQSTGNAAEATIQGVEIETIIQATENLVFTFSYGYTDAAYEKYEGLSGFTPEQAEDLDFARVPETTYGGSANYGLSLGDMGDLDFRAAMTYTDDIFLNDQNTVTAPDYTLWDASVTYTVPSDQWKVALFGKNLSNEEYAYYGTSLGALGENRFVGAPRTWGVRLSYDY